VLDSLPGNISQKYKEIFQKNPLFTGVRLPPDVKNVESLQKRHPKCAHVVVDFLKVRALRDRMSFVIIT